MAGFLIHTIVLAIAIWATANIVPGVTIASWTALAVAALVLGIVHSAPFQQRGRDLKATAIATTAGKAEGVTRK